MHNLISLYPERLGALQCQENVIWERFEEKRKVNLLDGDLEV
jgi:hypothetical protein